MRVDSFETSSGPETVCQSLSSGMIGVRDLYSQRTPAEPDAGWEVCLLEYLCLMMSSIRVAGGCS